MTLQRQAFGAQAVIHRNAIAVWQELAEMRAADGTFNLIAPIKRTNEKTEHIAQLDEPLTRKNACKKSD